MIEIGTYKPMTLKKRRVKEFTLNFLENHLDIFTYYMDKKNQQRKA